DVDKSLKALIDAQVGREVRLSKLEEAHQLLINLARIQEGRIDGQDEARLHSDARLDTLIDSQITFGQRFEQMTARVDRIGEHLDQVAAMQSENAAAIKTLIAVQTRTDEQIKALLDRNGTAKPKHKASKKAGAKKATRKAKRN